MRARWFLLTSMMTMLPDADHLLGWRDVYWTRILPGLAELLRFEGLRLAAPPYLILHHWGIAMIGLLMIATRRLPKFEKWIWSIVLGFSIHFILDGVVMI